MKILTNKIINSNVQRVTNTFMIITVFNHNILRTILIILKKILESIIKQIATTIPNKITKKIMNKITNNIIDKITKNINNKIIHGIINRMINKWSKRNSIYKIIKNIIDKT